MSLGNIHLYYTVANEQFQLANCNLSLHCSRLCQAALTFAWQFRGWGVEIMEEHVESRKGKLRIEAPALSFFPNLPCAPLHSQFTSPLIWSLCMGER